jgi:uncharacterized protein
MITRAVLGLSVAADAGLVLVLFVSGVVKGVLGIGLPLVSVPLAAQFLRLPAAVALLTVPMVATNIAQALEGGPTWPSVRRLLPIIGALVLGTLIGVHLLLNIDQRALNGVVGTSFVVLSATLLCLPRIRVAKRVETWASPCVGLAAGVLGGMSAMFGPPLVAYQIGLGVDPPTFVKHMAILALTGSAALLLLLGTSGSMSATDLLISAAAVAPIRLGMPIGRWLRRRVPPILFRAAVLGILAWAGIDMLHRAFS